MRTWAVLLGALMAAGTVAVSCGPSATPTATPAPTATPTRAAVAPAAPTPTSAGPAVATATPTRALVATATPTATATPQPASKRPSEWVVVLSQEIGEADPLTEYGTTAQDQVQQHVMEPIITVGLLPDSGQWGLIPVLASKWELTGRTTLAVTLRQGMKFHNGEELTAEHVKFVHDEIVRTKVPSFRFAGVGPLGTATVVDKYTVRFDLPEPQLLAAVGFERMQVPALTRKTATAEEFGRKPVGTGPYRALEYTRDQPVRLEAWDAYRGGVAFPPRITIRYVAEPTTRTALLLAGTAHIVQAFPVEGVPQVKGNKDLQVVSEKERSFYTHAINVFRPPFRDTRVRQAMNYAIDREGIVSQILEGRGSAQTSAIGPGQIGYTQDLKPYPYDPAKAKALLTEAGFPNGFTFEWVMTKGVFPSDAEIAEAAASQLGKVGIKAVLVPTDRARLRSQREEGSYEMLQLNWGASWDPTTYLRTSLTRNYTDKVLEPKWGPPPPALVEARRLHAQATSAASLEEMEQVYRQLNSLWREEAFYLFSAAFDTLWGVRGNTEWRPYPMARFAPFYDYWALIGKRAPVETDIPIAFKPASR